MRDQPPSNDKPPPRDNNLNHFQPFLAKKPIQSYLVYLKYFAIKYYNRKVGLMIKMRGQKASMKKRFSR